MIMTSDATGYTSLAYFGPSTSSPTSPYPLPPPTGHFDTQIIMQGFLAFYCSVFV